MIVEGLIRNIKNMSRISSKWRRLGRELLQKIADYMVEKPYYTFEDYESRNGTYVMNRDMPVCELLNEMSYQF